MKSRRPVNFEVSPLTEVTNMNGRKILSVAMTTLVVTIIGQATTYQEEVFKIERGEYARQIDKSIQCRIENDLRQSDLNWEVTRLAPTASQRLLKLRKGVTRVTVSIQYLLTPDDAAKHLQFRLQMISVPSFKPLKELGEEAYLLTEHGIIWFRIGKVVVEVSSSDGLIKTQRTVADQIVASVNKGIDRRAKRVSYGSVSVWRAAR